MISPFLPGVSTSSHVRGRPHCGSWALAVPVKPTMNTAGSNAARHRQIIILYAFLIGNTPRVQILSKAP